MFFDILEFLVSHEASRNGVKDGVLDNKGVSLK